MKTYEFLTITRSGVKLQLEFLFEENQEVMEDMNIKHKNIFIGIISEPEQGDVLDRVALLTVDYDEVIEKFKNNSNYENEFLTEVLRNIETKLIDEQNKTRLYLYRITFPIINIEDKPPMLNTILYGRFE